MVVCGLLVAACGGGDDAGVAAREGKAAAPTLQEARGATGDVTICAGKDTSGDQRDLIDTFNEQFGSEGLQAKLLEFPASADEQHNQIVQRQEARSSECDIYKADTIFIAELVSQDWLLDMTDYVDERKDEFIPSTLATVEIGGRYYGVPYDTDAPLLFYRSDAVSRPPATWQDVYGEARAKGGIVYQGASYEGLTCDFLDVAFAAGGKVLSEDGSKSVIDSPENLAALELMVEGIETGSAPRAVVTYMEEESRRAFESGRYAFMRNWPYAYALGNRKGSKIADEFEVAPLPAFEGAGKGGVLGGKDYVISSFSKNPEAAVRFIDYATSAEQNARRAVRFALVPAIGTVFDRPAVKRAMPFAAQLRQAVTQANVRPVSPVYPQISKAIYKNVNAALAGEISPQEALDLADSQINDALATF
jgi:multiple sugar transport system substrate-binding protein